MDTIESSTGENILGNEITGAEKVKKNPQLLSVDLSGETVILSIQNGQYYGLNAVASRIWDIIDNPTLVKDLYQIIFDEFDVDRDTCCHTVNAFMKELQKLELVNLG
ncbi:thymidylate synthase-like protein [Oleiphilus messinensis]|uniref:Thymidylate synthase-like protein n=1 Tax=Oleiphilus messinensis TaxID=141451 RepID=A0A1Y0IBS5_9GAMM|nr:PqqD family peptide modification chaperone [Oleiphilus messinensis]ARU57710.1 thymidylate synthase-like protein [Oleiphilus messinensis]